MARFLDEDGELERFPDLHGVFLGADQKAAAARLPSAAGVLGTVYGAYDARNQVDAAIGTAMPEIHMG